MKPNQNNSSIMQALLDLKSSGGDSSAIDILTLQIENNNKILDDADTLFQKHRYPEYKLTWCRLQSSVEFSRFLSVNALAILIAMCQNMNTWNNIQISYRDIIHITTLNSLKSIKPALKELIDKGCIAVHDKGTTKRPTVYMVNPEISTVGNKHPNLQDIFWKLVESNAVSDGGEKSNPHELWDALTSKRTYAKGNDSLISHSDKKITFGKINEIKEKVTHTENGGEPQPKRKRGRPRKSQPETPKDNDPVPEEECDEELPSAFNS